MRSKNRRLKKLSCFLNPRAFFENILFENTNGLDQGWTHMHGHAYSNTFNSSSFDSTLQVQGDIYYAAVDTHVGTIHLGMHHNKVCFLSFVGRARFDEWCARYAPQATVKEELLKHPIFQELNAYFSGTLRTFQTEFVLTGTPFQLDVYRELLEIPYGDTRSYGDIAKRLGDPDLGRAVGNANAHNPIALLVPCHRVVGSNGKLRGFAGGVQIQKALLRLEYQQTTTQLSLLSM